MRISQAFPSKYLRAADIGDKQPIVAIDRVVMENIAQGEDDKPIIYFERREKGVVLNKTNANLLSTVYGDDTSKWRGELVKLFTARVDFQGKTVDAIRFKIPTRAEENEWRAKKGTASDREPGEDERPTAKAGGDDDEVPF